MRLLLFALLILGGCASAGIAYDHPFKGKTHIYIVSQSDLRDRCSGWFAPQARGCSYHYDSGLPTATCFIFIDKRYQKNKAWVAAIKQHENRHCNGYRGET